MQLPGPGGARILGHRVQTMNRIARSLSATVLGALLTCIATLTHADAGNPTEHYTGHYTEHYTEHQTRVPAGADGIGKRAVGALPWQHLVVIRKRSGELR